VSAPLSEEESEVAAILADSTQLPLEFLESSEISEDSTEIPTALGEAIFGMRIGAHITESPDRQPRIIKNSGNNNKLHPKEEGEEWQEEEKKGWEEEEKEEWEEEEQNWEEEEEESSTYSYTHIHGQYQEINPGQYHEVNPGQYNEINPGQYNEINPGQYNELNPGQYIERHPGQDLKIDDVTVETRNTDQAKIYNVQAKAGDFILGETGKINVDSGQTFEAVRWTAVDGFLDQGQISDIIKKYFGAATTG